MTGQAGFFDVDERLQRLSDLGDQLEAYAATVDFEIFRAPLEAALAYADGVKGGRPAYDAVMMFKILVIQAQNNLSDDRTEFLINDRLSFMRFLGLSLGERVPDAKTIWLFRERLTRAGAIETLFDRFDQAVRAAGYIAMSGQIVDASLIAAPKQRNTDAEKTDIKAGRIPPEWSKTPARLRQKDRDARWTVKFSKAKPRADGTTPVDIAIPTFGYQNHISTDRCHGLIRKWAVTDAAAYEGAHAAPRTSRQDQYWFSRVGRHRLPLEEERGVPGAQRLHQSDPSQEAHRPPDAYADPPRQWPQVCCAVAHRACLRRAEGQNGPLHPNHRTRSGTTQDRARQPRLQHQTLHLVGANCGGDIAGPQGSLPTTIKRRSPTSRKDPKSL